MSEPVVSPPLDAHRGWPVAVLDELARRDASIRSRLSVELPLGAAVLTLGSPDADAEVHEAALVARTDQVEPRYDAVVSIAALVGFADAGLAVRGIDHLLRPEAPFVFVEPVAVPGWRGIIEASVGSHLRAVRHRHVARDIPLAVRSAGLIITDIERFTMPSSTWPLRPFVDATACRFTEVDR